MRASDANQSLAGVSASYANDRKTDQRWAVAFAVLGVLSLVGSCFVFWRAASEAAAGDAFKANRFFALASAGLPLLMLSALLMYLANRQRLATAESRRLERQYAGLDVFLAPLPAEVQHLLRGSMAQRFFPRLLEDTDPLREPVWPTTDELRKASRRSGAAGRPAHDHPSGAETGTSSVASPPTAV